MGEGEVEVGIREIPLSLPLSPSPPPPSPHAHTLPLPTNPLYTVECEKNFHKFLLLSFGTYSLTLVVENGTWDMYDVC